MTELIKQRTIKSWIKRHPRLSPTQKELLESQHLTHYFTQDSKDKFISKVNDITSSFDSIVLDIGFGLGHSTLHTASNNPNTLLLGFDPHPNGSCHILRTIEQQKYLSDRPTLKNIMLYAGDCLDILHHQKFSHLADSIHIFCPDPWPKKKHHKRRLIQTNFLKLLSNFIKPTGIIYIATDWDNYAQHIQSCIDQTSLKSQSTRPKFFKFTRPLTKYESRGLNLGHKIQEFYLQKP